MEDNKFKPEEDFEEENLDIIKSLREIKDEQLPDNFDNGIIKEINKHKKESKIPELFKKILINISKFKLAYSLGLAIFTATCLLILNPTRIEENKNAVITKIDSIGKDKGKIENSIAGKFGEEKGEQKAEKIFELVKRNMSYGFLYEVSQKDVQNQLSSEEFKQTISEIKNPVIDDTVRVIIKLIENNNR